MPCLPSDLRGKVSAALVNVGKEDAGEGGNATAQAVLKGLATRLESASGAAVMDLTE